MKVTVERELLERVIRCCDENIEAFRAGETWPNGEIKDPEVREAIEEEERMVAEMKAALVEPADERADVGRVSEFAVERACDAYNKWLSENINSDASNQAWPSAMHAALSVLTTPQQEVEYRQSKANEALTTPPSQPEPVALVVSDDEARELVTEALQRAKDNKKYLDGRNVVDPNFNPTFTSGGDPARATQALLDELANWDMRPESLLAKRVAELRAALATTPPQEPVAWGRFTKDGRLHSFVTSKYDVEFLEGVAYQFGETVSPMYLAPPATDEAVQEIELAECQTCDWKGTNPAPVGEEWGCPVCIEKYGESAEVVWTTYLANQQEGKNNG